MENLKPIAITVAPALGGNILGIITPGSTLTVIPFLQCLAYVISILIGIFQLCKYLKDTDFMSNIKVGVVKVKNRWMATNNTSLKLVGDFCVFVALPAVETMSFYQPELESKRLVIAGILIGIKGITNFSKSKTTA